MLLSWALDGGEASFLAFPRLRLALCGFGLWLGRGSALLYPQLGVGGWPPAVSPTGKKVQFEGCQTGRVKERRKRTIFTLRKLLSLGPSRPSEDLVQVV